MGALAAGRRGTSSPTCRYGSSRAAYAQGGSAGGRSVATSLQTICRRAAPNIRAPRFVRLENAGWPSLNLWNEVALIGRCRSERHPIGRRWLRSFVLAQGCSSGLQTPGDYGSSASGIERATAQGVTVTLTYPFVQQHWFPGEVSRRPKLSARTRITYSPGCLKTADVAAVP